MLQPECCSTQTQKPRRPRGKLYTRLKNALQRSATCRKTSGTLAVAISVLLTLLTPMPAAAVNDSQVRDCQLADSSRSGLQRPVLSRFLAADLLRLLLNQACLKQRLRTSCVHFMHKPAGRQALARISTALHLPNIIQQHFAYMQLAAVLITEC